MTVVASHIAGPVTASTQESDMNGPNTVSLWREALTHWGVWRRSLIIGLTVGCIQVTVNQGDHWLRWQIDSSLILKTLITPLIGLSVALFSAAGAFVELRRRELLRDAI